MLRLRDTVLNMGTSDFDAFRKSGACVLHHLWLQICHCLLVLCTAMLNIAHRYSLLLVLVFDYCVVMQCLACHQMNARHNYSFTWSWQSTEMQQEGRSKQLTWDHWVAKALHPPLKPLNTASSCMARSYVSNDCDDDSVPDLVFMLIHMAFGWHV